LCFREPLQKRKVFIRQRYRDRAHGRRLATETVDFKNGGGALKSQDLRLEDFETRVRPVPSQSPIPSQPLAA
jgi:hypothetical protein